MQQRPSKTLFAGYAEDDPNLSERAAAPEDVPDPQELEEAEDAALTDPPFVDGTTLVREIAELRGRFEAAQVRILDELRDLREENERLEEENLRWKTLVGEYKQILNAR